MEYISGEKIIFRSSKIELIDNIQDRLYIPATISFLIVIFLQHWHVIKLFVSVRMNLPIYLKSLFSLFLMLVFVNSCQAGNSASDLSMDSAFERFYFVHFGVNYPGNEYVLKHCKKNNSTHCLEIYAEVRKAKHYLLSEIKKDKNAVFTQILTTIQQQCPVAEASNQHISEYRCYGAITALYFYTDAEYDKKIQQLVANASKSLLDILLRFRLEWMYNRPDAEQWIALIGNLPTTHITKKHGIFIIKYFEESQKPYDKFGLML